MHSFESIKSMFDTIEGKFPEQKLYTFKFFFAGAMFFQPEENDALNFSGFLIHDLLVVLFKAFNNFLSF